MPRTLKVVLHVTVEDHDKSEIADLAKNAMDCAPADMHTTANLNVKEIGEAVADTLGLSDLNDHIVDYNEFAAFYVTNIKSVEVIWLPN